MRITSNLTDETILVELGTRLAAARLARNLTQAALADEAGVSKRTVERLESGEVAARLSGLIRVCRALGLGDRLDTWLPAPTPSPLEQLERAGHRRQRASGARVAPTPAAPHWTWGDER